MKRSDVAVALAMLAVSATTFVAGRKLPYWGDFAPGSGFAIFWVAAASTGLSLALLVASLRGRSEDTEPDAEPGALGRIAVAVAALATVPLLMPLVGLVGSILPLMAILLFVVQRRPLLPSLAAAAVTVAVVHLVFVEWLDIAFPKGSFGI